MDFETYYEALEFAIDREAESNRFYLELAGQMERPTLQKLFENFAEEELKHKAKLELEMMKEGRTVKNPAAVLTLEDGPRGMTVEPDLEISYEDALILGMQREKKAFRLYIDLAAMVRDEDTREMLMTLAEEEARHKLLFEIEYDKVTLQGK